MRGTRITLAGILALVLILCGCDRQESQDVQQGETAGEAEVRDESIAMEKRQDEIVETEHDEAVADEKVVEDFPEIGENVQKQAPKPPVSATFSVLGDSISTFQGYNPEGYYAFFPENGEVKEVEDAWWQIVAGDLDLTLYVNGSSSGATVVGDSTGTEDPQCACNEFRTNGLAGPGNITPERIIVYLGTNDVLQTVSLGDNDGTGIVIEGEIATFSDAYTLMLDKLQANYPLAQIYCCTLLQIGDYGTQTPYVEFVNGEQLTAADYSEVIVRIAGNRGLSVIDLYNCGVTIENLQEMSSDGVHPTAAGMRQIAAAVEAALAGEK